MNDISKVSDEVLINEYSSRFTIKKGEIISDSQIAARNFTALIRDKITEREYFMLMLLDGQNRVIKTEILFSATLTSSVVYPREIVRSAIINNSASVIIGHNHPSGNLNASSDDTAITRKIKNALKTVDIPLLDHIIVVPGGDYTSFETKGLI